MIEELIYQARPLPHVIRSDLTTVDLNAYAGKPRRLAELAAGFYVPLKSDHVFHIALRTSATPGC